MGGIKHIYTQPLTSFETTAKEVLGSIRREDGKMYKYVKFVKGAGSAAIALGNILRYNGGAAPATGYDANEVTADAAASVDVGAGVALYALTTAQMDAGAFGWMLIRGAVLVSQDLAAIGIGVAVTVFAAGPIADGTCAVAAATTPREGTVLTTGAGTSRLLANFTT